MQIVVTDDPSAEDVEVVSSGLMQYNADTYDLWERMPLAVLVRDPETGKAVGGLVGRTSLGVLFVDTVHLPASLRGTGLGRKLLQEAESEAVRRGCRNAVLFTAAFHAPDFYAKLGWRVFGEIPSTPPGATRFWMTKELPG